MGLGLLPGHGLLQEIEFGSLLKQNEQNFHRSVVVSDLEPLLIVSPRHPHQLPVISPDPHTNPAAASNPSRSTQTCGTRQNPHHAWRWPGWLTVPGPNSSVYSRQIVAAIEAS